jgi:manganese/zinc/iron transport system permease protein
LFALGVVIINVFASRVHLDTDCVLYGELSLLSRGANEIAPQEVLVMGGVAIVVALLITLFYKELLVSSFDASLSASLGFPPRLIHLALMAILSIVVVSAFKSVGAILVIATLILPGATAQLISTRLSTCLWLSVLFAAISSVLGLHLGLWIDSSIAAAVVVCGTGLFALAWLFGPHGALHRRLGAQEGKAIDPEKDAPQADGVTE